MIAAQQVKACVRLLVAWMAAAAFFSMPLALGHTMEEQVSAYKDTQGLSRDRFKIDMNLNFAHSYEQLSGTAYNLTASQERYAEDTMDNDEYTQKTYQTRERTTNAATMTATQTWKKTTDTRVLFSGSRDPLVTSSTGGVGTSHWFFGDTLQASLDASRTIVRRPDVEVLGENVDIANPPPVFSSTGTSVGLKYLATPKTILTSGINHIETNDRPPENIYSVGFKQYIVPTKSAIHVDGTRVVNRGTITSATTFGSVDAWIGEVAFLQTLWRGANTRFSYRYYQEQETQPVTDNVLQRGSDTFGFNFSQDVGDKTIEAAAYRYLTNDIVKIGKVSADVYEMGLLARF